jgi:hypothetical protein
MSEERTSEAPININAGGGGAKIGLHARVCRTAATRLGTGSQAKSAAYMFDTRGLQTATMFANGRRYPEEMQRW